MWSIFAQYRLLFSAFSHRRTCTVQVCAIDFQPAVPSLCWEPFELMFQIFYPYDLRILAWFRFIYSWEEYFSISQRCSNLRQLRLMTDVNGVAMTSLLKAYSHQLCQLQSLSISYQAEDGLQNGLRYVYQNKSLVLQYANLVDIRNKFACFQWCNLWLLFYQSLWCV